MIEPPVEFKKIRRQSDLLFIKLVDGKNVTMQDVCILVTFLSIKYI